MQLLLYRLVYHFGLLNIADVTRREGRRRVHGRDVLVVFARVRTIPFDRGAACTCSASIFRRRIIAICWHRASPDFLRRINIYWKDFIMKLFFYPAFFALRRMGTLRAMSSGHSGAFFATWALHSWQWFWFRGHLLLTWQDISFWSILASLVLVNATSRSRFRSPPVAFEACFICGHCLLVGLKTAGTFVSHLCALDDVVLPVAG